MKMKHALRVIRINSIPSYDEFITFSAMILV